MGCLRFSAIVALVVSFAVVVVYRAVVLCPVTASPVDLTGRTIIVTGSSAGIGVEAARFLVAWNATVIMAVRNLAKGTLVKQQLEEALPSTSTGTLELWQLDLASFSSIRAFASKWESSGRALDVLMNNAGMTSGDLQITADDIEMTYQVNHLGPFLLTRLLLPALLRARQQRGEARIVHVSSSMHFAGQLEVGDHSPYSERTRNRDPFVKGMQLYGDTKLMNVLFSNHLHTLLQPHGITSSAVHPGLVVSELDRGALSPSFHGLAVAVREAIARPTRDGAVAQVTVATHPALKRKGGMYFEDRCIDDLCRECVWCFRGDRYGVEPNRQASDKRIQQWLWDTSCRITGLPLQLDL